MTHSKEEASCRAESAFDLISAVKGLNGRSSKELHILLRETEDLRILVHNEKGLPEKVDVGKLAAFLPLHLIAVILTSDRDEEKFRYMLSGLRLLHTLCDLAPRHSKLEQVLLDDVKLSEQMLDLVFYLLIVLASNKQGIHGLDGLLLIHAPMVASSLYLLHGCISSQWQDLVLVLLAHPMVQLFMDASFGAVHNAIRSLEMILLHQDTDIVKNTGVCGESAAYYYSLQAEASLQFLHSLCKQKPFRERLVKSKELCGNGGVLVLGRSILSLSLPPQYTESSTIAASISRMKAKILSILLYLFEAESVSFLDEVATVGNLHLAKSIAIEVVDLLRTTLRDNSGHLKAPSKPYPMGFVQLNAMRLTELFTDDSNFRSFFTEHFSEVLSAIFSLSHGDFLSIWCCSNLPSREEEATLEYDQFAAAQWILELLSSPNQANVPGFIINLLPNNLPMASYVHRRTSNLIKMIANLHCFVPNICEEQEKHRFIHNFIGGLQKDLSKVLPGFVFISNAQRNTGVCRNLRLLLSHAESLIPKFLNEEDLQLLRAFYDHFQSLVRSGYGESQVQEAQSTGGCSTLDQREKPSNLHDRNGYLDEVTPQSSASRGKDVKMQVKKEEKKIVSGSKNNDQSIETHVSDAGSSIGKSSIDRNGNGEFQKSFDEFRECGMGEVKEEEKVEKQRRKRKRSIMNDEQMAMIEKALLDEPDMQRNSASIQLWADKLCLHGAEVSSSQLRNWLNNRKAKLARASKHSGPVREASADFPDSPGPPGNEIISTKFQPLMDAKQIPSTTFTASENSKPPVESIKQGHEVLLFNENEEKIS